MATFHEQDCPLCDSPAEYGWVDGENRKYFQCPVCGYFQISKHAERLLLEYYQHRKAAYSALAKQAPEDHLLFIRMPSHEFRQNSDDKLQATHVAKTDLPLDCK
jgi:hypothetical protein